MKNIAIFASGAGSNAKKIIEHFKPNNNIHVKLIVSNKKTAPVLEIGRENEIDTATIRWKDFYEKQNILEKLNKYSIDFVVLAGFLWLIPEYLTKAYFRKMVNIHPALLPKYGGKGMYGINVHKAVYEAGEKESGITIHYVNEKYDEGAIVFQAKCPIDPADQPADIASKILVLEHKHFARVVEQLLTD
ncbi:MAG: phosphoribosylglycinamide formyltransferase [Bacteroidetes bacterium]|nr:phosphoribosylglycinamide formyltransferase [Bacteroidota bacterium]